MRGEFNYLQSRHLFSLAPHPAMGQYTRGGTDFGLGSGHNGPLWGVVPTVVGFLLSLTRAYPPPTTPQRQNAKPSYVCVRMRVHEANAPLCRCAVVTFSYPYEKKEEKATTVGTTLALSTVVGVVACLANSLKPLTINKIMGFY